MVVPLEGKEGVDGGRSWRSPYWSSSTPAVQAGVGRCRRSCPRLAAIIAAPGTESACTKPGRLKSPGRQRPVVICCRRSLYGAHARRVAGFKSRCNSILPAVRAGHRTGGPDVYWSTPIAVFAPLPASGQSWYRTPRSKYVSPPDLASRNQQAGEKMEPGGDPGRASQLCAVKGGGIYSGSWWNSISPFPGRELYVG